MQLTALRAAADAGRQVACHLGRGHQVGAYQPKMRGDRMSNSQDCSGRSPGFVGMPRTRLGWWSIGLAITFLALFVLWLLYVQATPIARPTFFSDPLHAFLILGAAAAAITGAIVGALALVAKREQSFMLVLSILLGVFVLYWAIAELMGH
jgi:uncharacterized integral membrane protein